LKRAEFHDKEKELQELLFQSQNKVTLSNSCGDHLQFFLCRVQIKAKTKIGSTSLLIFYFTISPIYISTGWYGRQPVEKKLSCWNFLKHLITALALVRR
jgi:hypothetical protein